MPAKLADASRVTHPPPSSLATFVALASAMHQKHIRCAEAALERDLLPVFYLHVRIAKAIQSTIEDLTQNKLSGDQLPETSADASSA